MFNKTRLPCLLLIGLSIQPFLVIEFRVYSALLVLRNEIRGTRSFRGRKEEQKSEAGNLKESWFQTDIYQYIFNSVERVVIALYIVDKNAYN